VTQFYDVEYVLFDCDSTLSSLEGIDELAKQIGVYEQLAPLTQAAMEGKVKLDDIYKQRLELIQPDKQAIDWVAQRYVETMVSDAYVVIEKLLKANKTYTGFDEQSPLARSGGKAVVSQQIIGESGKAVLIGDGVTDLEARNERIHFIGFGGIVVRDLVRSQSSDYIEEATLLPLLDCLLPRS